MITQKDIIILWMLQQPKPKDYNVKMVKKAERMIDSILYRYSKGQPIAEILKTLGIYNKQEANDNNISNNR